jgi:HSP20 family molecular chaperone IbpA
MEYHRLPLYTSNPLREIERMNRMMEEMPNIPQIGSELKYNDKGDLSVRCHIAGFKPEELTVNVDGQTLTITGKHNETKENESVERHFRRVVCLPNDFDQSQIKCELDDKGEMCICVPRREQLNAPKQKVPIEMKKNGN